MARPQRYCKQGHPLFGANLTVKERSRVMPSGKIITWKERCCNECYDQWRANYQAKVRNPTAGKVIA